ncbi:hypothetical protein PC9H_009302 [Pleurotus ostreatus]|uniref:Uncharacterized protein n=1 Tax=Pleurotus ostreatus TaxID=5322 RepID=A0A8H7DPH6_PLEOS|nr:uncharacterized protein PC9H_009302 [Pleurotus ostreatus]KAF7424002.1 hypothetical protein PC9H_009302 [Pleurotus ostreatus]
MSARIFTFDPNRQREAACILSDALRDLGYPHAYIGGYAMRLLGSTRFTEIIGHDIDVLIKPGKEEMKHIRQKLIEVDPHFANIGVFKLYCQILDPDAPAPQSEARAHVLIETLATGNLGLPTAPEPTLQFSTQDLPIELPVLHPSVLILTKLKRWTNIFASSRPKSRKKAASDLVDITFLVQHCGDKPITSQRELRC